ncbi:MAG: hypothetical protein ACRCTZ_15910 [Sarcina sp.]
MKKYKIKARRRLIIKLLGCAVNVIVVKINKKSKISQNTFFFRIKLDLNKSKNNIIKEINESEDTSIARRVIVIKVILLSFM